MAQHELEGERTFDLNLVAWDLFLLLIVKIENNGAVEVGGLRRKSELKQES